MTTKSNQRLHCYMGLATLLLLTWFSTSLKTMVVAGSSPSQRALRVDRSGARVKRYLRSRLNVAETIDGDNEERGFDFGFLSASTIKEAVVEGAQQTFNYARHTIAPKNQKTIDQRFLEFGLDTVEIDLKAENLFRHNMYRNWAQSVDDAYGEDGVGAAVAKVSTLLSQYDENTVIKMLATGKSAPDTKVIAENLEIGLLIKWTADDKRTDDIFFKLLHFDKDAGKILENPLLSIWIYYASKMKKKPHEVLYEKLANIYGDDELPMLLAMAKNDKATKTIAKRLEKLQMETWKDGGARVVDIFKILQLDKTNPTTILASPVLSTWASYAKVMNLKPYDMLFSSMLESAGDLGLARILAAAKGDGTNTKIVQKLQDRQVKKWLDDKKSGGDVFQLLGLKERGNKMFESSVWSTWVSYMVMLEKNKQDPEIEPNVPFEIASVLVKEMGGKALLKLVTTARDVSVTRSVAAGLERSVWKITGQTPDKVFDLLKLKKKGIDSEEFISWLVYVKQLDVPKEITYDFAHISVLKKRFGSSLQKMLEDALTKAGKLHDEDRKKIFTELLTSLKKMKALEKLQKLEKLENLEKLKELEQVTLLKQKKGPMKRIWTWLHDNLDSIKGRLSKIWRALVGKILALYIGRL